MRRDRDVSDVAVVFIAVEDVDVVVGHVRAPSIRIVAATENHRRASVADEVEQMS